MNELQRVLRLAPRTESIYSFMQFRCPAEYGHSSPIERTARPAPPEPFIGNLSSLKRHCAWLSFTSKIPSDFLRETADLFKARVKCVEVHSPAGSVLVLEG